MGYEVTRFIANDDINEDLKCCICSFVLEEPVWSYRCEHAFCKLCINEWLSRQNTCPHDRQALNQCDLKPVPRFMRNILDKLQIRCDFVSDGCTQVIKLEALRQHIAVCDFNPDKQVECVNGCGLTIKKADIISHNCVRDLRKSLNSLIDGHVKHERVLTSLRYDINLLRNENIRLNDIIISWQNDVKNIKQMFCLKDGINSEPAFTAISSASRTTSTPIASTSFAAKAIDRDRNLRPVPNPYVLITPLQSSSFTSVSTVASVRNELNSLDEPSSSTSGPSGRLAGEEPLFKKRTIRPIMRPITSTGVELIRSHSPEFSLEMRSCITSPHIMPRFYQNSLRPYSPAEQTPNQNEDNEVQASESNNYLDSNFIQLDVNPDFGVAGNEIVEENNAVEDVNSLETFEDDDDVRAIEDQ